MLRLIVDDQPLARFEILTPIRVRDFIVPRTMPDGSPFISDGESVPWFARWVFPRASKAILASFAHDYRMKTAHTITARFSAHRHFREDLRAYGISNWRRQIMWRVALLADNRIPILRRLKGVWE